MDLPSARPRKVASRHHTTSRMSTVALTRSRSSRFCTRRACRRSSSHAKRCTRRTGTARPRCTDTARQEVGFSAARSSLRARATAFIARLFVDTVCGRCPWGAQASPGKSFFHERIARALTASSLARRQRILPGILLHSRRKAPTRARTLLGWRAFLFFPRRKARALPRLASRARRQALQEIQEPLQVLLLPLQPGVLLL